MFASSMLRLHKALIVAAVVLSFFSAALGQSKEKVIHTFHGGKDGVVPWAWVIQDSLGNLFGTTGGGGSTDCDGAGCGVVFELSPKAGRGWTEKILHRFHFDGTDGVFPDGRLTIDQAGNLYGTTVAGGSGCSGFGCSTVFKLSQSGDGNWKARTLHSFNGADGELIIFTGVVLDSNGNVYGTTYSGGAHNAGVLFQLSQAKNGTWTETVLHDFTGGKDGQNPGQLVIDHAGNLYGITAIGGRYNHGSFFQVSRRAGGWKYALLYSFKPNQDGLFPYSVVSDHRGAFYGNLSSQQSDGAVFRLKNTNGRWKEKVIFTFDFNDGAQPANNLAVDSAGNIYGTTEFGGKYDFGVVYELSPMINGWKQRVLHTFAGGKDGTRPVDGVTVGQSGHVYGTTNEGGSSGVGVVFEVTP